MDLLLIYEINKEISLAFWWFLIPILIGGATVIAAIACDSSETTTLRGTALAVLGMQESGKTQLYATLQNKTYNTYTGTVKEKIAGFKFHIGSKEITIADCWDIGGDESYIRAEYERLIKEGDIIFFIFDVKRYLNDFKYATDTRNRLDWIFVKLKNKYGDDYKLKTKYAVLGSHFDQLPDDQKKSALKNLQKSLEGKKYEIMFENNLLLCDLRDREALLKLFKEKHIFE